MSIYLSGCGNELGQGSNKVKAEIVIPIQTRLRLVNLKPDWKVWAG